ncbi:helix-turn-helix transcriptional regulator [Actinokineospora iranica]|uniref:Regulatory protein, luxR family n=1 Tax=Actinokineospora iranica TaxID=1271860 RepID=A0A1G6WE89_9PSEU|nr:LuxR C-terminal-related transcriptional regulator [Actinokineospora iranica]SDD63386.1 regulatory protein, luxR family [Actinokineospora iranica]
MIPGHVQPSELLLDDPTRRLCAAITSGGLTARLAVIAPGGYGKSALLGRLATTPGAQRYRRGLDGAPSLLLVDDAHLLADADLAELTALAADDRVGLVVAARPRPRPAALARLLGRLRGQIVLRPFERERVAALLSATLGGPVPDALVALAHTQTGGVPGLLHRLAPHLSRASVAVPASAVEEFRFEFDCLDPDTLRVLLAAEVGVGGDPDLLAGLLDRPVADVIDEVRASGLLGADGAPPPLVAAALRELVPSDQRSAVFAGLADAALARGGALLDFATALLGTNAVGASVAAVYAAAAAEAEPAVAVRLHEAAAGAGHPVDEVCRAEAEARAGDLDAALRRADGLVATAGGERRAAAARVAAAALAYRGQLSRSAELYQWSGAGPCAAFAAVGLAGTGRIADAELALKRAADDEPPTLFTGAVSLAARGILESVTGSGGAGLSTVVRAAEVLEPVGRDVLLPDSPAALGAILALHTGAAGIAEPLLDRAVAARIGGALLRPRHTVLRAWTAMVRGDKTSTVDGAGLCARDWLFAVGLTVGTARRGSDLAALRRTWEPAYQAVVRHQVDLFTLLPLGEFAVAAARLGDRERFAPHLGQAWDLLRALGDPPAWTTMLHWSCLHAEIIAEHPEAAEDHAAALAANADVGPFYAAMAEAARCWRNVLAADIDADRVEAAARGLHAAGLWWDGARLAGQAAIRTADRKEMLSLLDCARMLQGGATQEDTVTDHSGAARLSEREAQVAGLVLDGLTYKQIGDRLFISAKTVEHHMARMRSRLGATSRSDLLSQLRSLLGDRSA